jgi:hypothetical protein
MYSLDREFNGYVDGTTWNGWICPYFLRLTAEDVLRASEPKGYHWTYDAERDTYVVSSEQDPPDYAPEEFAGRDLSISGELVHVYAIGAYSWSWELASNE